MTEHKHTDGPWEAEKFDGPVHRNQWRVIFDNDKCTGVVAHLCDNVNESVEANAQLIAAAPELLEALENLTAEARKVSKPENDELRVRIGLALAVIDRAKGE